MRFWSKSLLLHLVKISGIFYISPINLSYWWNFGILALYFLISQVLTGILLAMFYNPNSSLAFSIIMDLNNEVYYGWWIRYVHANGASFFFLAVYVHMFRSIYYGSFLHPRQLLWFSGMIIFLLMIITAFLGYILPWGQMSFWGAMVITSLLAAIPLIGSDLIFLLWGGYSIDDATLHRFYSLHFTLPFILVLCVIIHLLFLHEFGSNNPLGIPSFLDNAPFSVYYTLKDGFSVILILIIFVYIFTLNPDLLGHSVNYEKANFLVTPAHIVPEWYLLVFYAILRSVTNKLLGFFFMICSIAVLFYLPYLLKGFLIRSSVFKPWHASWFWMFVSTAILLGWIGGLPVMEPYLSFGQFLCLLYFLILLLFFPLGGPIERLIYDAYIFQAGEKEYKESRELYRLFTAKTIEQRIVYSPNVFILNYRKIRYRIHLKINEIICRYM